MVAELSEHLSAREKETLVLVQRPLTERVPRSSFLFAVTNSALLPCSSASVPSERHIGFLARRIQQPKSQRLTLAYDKLENGPSERNGFFDSQQHEEVLEEDRKVCRRCSVRMFDQDVCQRRAARGEGHESEFFGPESEYFVEFNMHIVCEDDEHVIRHEIIPL
ncbi:hypothetical protein BDZ97DRAFT_1434311 [Flammula alnicola]|nr:hypothetical protein BDZ97DRAFT_1434311 [Flammula alnicola]